ncbi:hypothetical protein [Photobacterium lipolyticum]|uniref:Uncharacterized protein n=1 Tax=Photobacterium lipolyticum TaxID=266810 RepID=A0A2T3MS95_9GAMM|nr:hypothetical protein [Photobacterium lipolyticum]PSW00648.1 hypothetical protein C9I89_20780 [Photobacterium lipolyticum]
MPCKAKTYQLAAALSALLGGLMVYLLERPAESIYLFALFSYSYSPDYDLLGAFDPLDLLATLFGAFAA